MKLFAKGLVLMWFVICYMLQKSVYTGGEEKGLGLRDGVSGLDLYGGLFTILSAVNKDIKFADTSWIILKPSNSAI